ncbi:hypothetical protein AAG906_031832 [Vitis piasezkii]
MVPILNSGNHLGYVLIGFGLFLSATAIVALCAKHAGFVSRKCNKTSSPKLVPKSPLASPKELLTSISNKAVPFIYKKKGGDEAGAETGACRVEEGSGEGGLWQKSILMGERCQHPEFSGVIFYDGYGNQVSEPPRTPRASPLPSFSYPMAKGVPFSTLEKVKTNKIFVSVDLGLRRRNKVARRMVWMKTPDPVESTVWMMWDHSHSNWQSQEQEGHFLSYEMGSKSQAANWLGHL